MREWCKRMARALAALTDPGSTATAGVAAAHAGGPAFGMSPPPPPSSGPGAAAKGALPSGYNAVAGFSALGFGGGDISSDEEDNVAGLSREERLKRKVGLSKGGGSSGRKQHQDSSDDEGGLSSDDAASSSSDDGSSGGNDSDSDALGGSSGDSDAGEHLPNPLSSLKLDGQLPGQSGQPSGLTGAVSTAKHRRAQRKAAKAAKKAREARAEAAALVVGAPDSASGVWGYPFGGPRSQTLFISRRSRRHRLFKWQLAMAMANVAEDNSLAAGGGVGGLGGAAAAAGVAGSSSGGSNSVSRYSALLGGPFGAGAGGSGSGSQNLANTMASAGLTDATGPMFSAESGFRLDQEGFWDSLPGGSSGWQELTGPNDPVVLAGKYNAAEGAGSAGGEITVVLRAFNRCGECGCFSGTQPICFKHHAVLAGAGKQRLKEGCVWG